MVDLQIAAVYPPQFAELVVQRGDHRLRFQVALGNIREDANAPHLVRRLRIRRNGPRGRAAEKRDELAPSHCLPLDAHRIG
jgi:hypothetical protein